MNERIQELAKQAREYANSSEPYSKIKNKAWIDVYDEKFAHLLLEDVLSTIESSDGDLDYCMWKISKDYGLYE